MGPAAQVELVVDDVRAAQLLVVGVGLVDLAGVHLGLHRSLFEAAHARPLDAHRETQPECVAIAGSRDVDPRLQLATLRDVGLTAQLERVEVDREVQAGALAMGERQSCEVDDRGWRLCHCELLRPAAYDGPSQRDYEMGQFDWTPDEYLERIRAKIPRYDDLQEQAIAAIPFPPDRVLELGMGTGETTRRLIEAYPDSWVVGLDASPNMVFRARQSYDDVQLARMEDPLPDGPWDLVISVLSVNDLTDEQKQALFRRVRDHSRSLVIGDVFEDNQLDSLVEWCDGEVTWQADGLAVVRATY